MLAVLIHQVLISRAEQQTPPVLPLNFVYSVKSVLRNCCSTDGTLKMKLYYSVVGDVFYILLYPT